MVEQPTKAVADQLAAFLSDIDAMVLSTVDAEGLPYATNLYLAPDRLLNLYFVSEPESHHSQHIERQPTVAVAGHAPIHMWQQVRGVQIRGQCRPVPEAEREQAWRIYYKRFPHITEIEDYVRAMNFYCIEPTRLRWIDNSVHFGYTVDFDFPLPAELQPSEHAFGIY
jgi:uncharacterized protein YhbP (UPF0306 family)